MLPVLPKTQLGCSQGRQIPYVTSFYCASGVCYGVLPCYLHSVGLQAWLSHRPAIYYWVYSAVKPVAIKADYRLAKESAHGASDILRTASWWRIELSFS